MLFTNGIDVYRRIGTHNFWQNSWRTITRASIPLGPPDSLASGPVVGGTSCAPDKIFRRLYYYYHSLEISGGCLLKGDSGFRVVSYVLRRLQPWATRLRAASVKTHCLLVAINRVQ